MLVYTTAFNGCVNVTADEQSPDAEQGNLTPEPENWKALLKHRALVRFGLKTPKNICRCSIQIHDDEEFDCEDFVNEDDVTHEEEGLLVNLSEKEIHVSEAWAVNVLNGYDHEEGWCVMSEETWIKVCEDEESIAIDWEVWLEGPDSEKMIDDGMAIGNKKEDENGESDAWRDAYDKAAMAIRYDLKQAGVVGGADDFPGPDGPYQDPNSREKYWISYTPSHERECECEDQNCCVCGCEDYRYRIKFIPQD